MVTNVILAFAESLSAPEVTWSLADHGFHVVALARRGRPSALRHSRFARVFEIAPPASDFTAAMANVRTACARVLQSSGAVGIMPLDDEAIWLCEKAGFEDRVVLIGPGGDQAELALNKQKQVELAQASGFSVPRTRCVERPEEVRAQLPEFPVVFKPALAVTVAGGGLSRGRSWTCSDRDELESAIEGWGGRGPMLLQPFIPGVGEGLFGLATAGGVLGWSGHRRLRMMNPQGSGSSACMASRQIDQACKSAGERFVRLSRWRGLFMIELLRDDSGKRWFMEFNGRSWGSMALARRLGLEYPAWAATMAFAPDSVPAVPRLDDTSLVCRHLGREILHLLFVLRGPRSKALRTWPSPWRTLLELCRLSSNQRWYNWRRDDPKVFFADSYRTIRDQLAKPAHRP